MTNSIIYLGLILAGASLVACSPKIYVIDRQTVLEEEAAGDWPQFEGDLLSKTAAQGPTPFSKVPVNNAKARLYNILNGEMAGGEVVGQNQTGAKK